MFGLRQRAGLVVLLLVLVAVASIPVWSGIDWTLLSGGGQLLFGPAGLHIYVRDTALQAGPLALVMFGVLQWLGPTAGVLAVHAAMWPVLAVALGGTAGCSITHFQVAARSRVERRQIPRWAVLVVGVLPALTWHLPPFDRDEQLLWASCAVLLGISMALPATGAWLRAGVSLTRAQWFGILLIGPWAWLASGTAHLEDAVAIGLLIWSARDSERGGRLRAALLVGLAVAFKPWAVGGFAVLIRSGRPALVVRDLALAAVVAAGAWLPFVLVAPATLHAAARPFDVGTVTPISLVLPSDAPAPVWLRTVQLAAILVASLAARRQGRVAALAAGLCLRLLLDPGASAYYLSTALLAIACADLESVRPGWRIGVGLVGLWLLPCLSEASPYVATAKAVSLLVLFTSYAIPWPDRRRQDSRLPAPAELDRDGALPILA